VISADTAQREAQTARISVQDRLDQLLIHGILHLLGYEHEHSTAEARKMEEKTKELLQLLETQKA
jgi:probable rRNA maturation factor